MKTELEKMLAGELFNASDEQLVRMRNKARRLFTIFNQTFNEEIGLRRKVLEELIPSIGQHVEIQPPFYCDYGTNIILGKNISINCNCTIIDSAMVKIGNNVFISPNVSFYSSFLPIKASERKFDYFHSAPIIIEENVWIGGNTTICQGVTIGKNSTIGAGSVVTRNIPANVFAAGNPCRVIKPIEE